MLAAVFAGMIVLGVATLSGNGVVLLVFGVIGLGLAVLNVVWIRRGRVRGRDRIAHHIIMMFAAAIAAVTAFLVVNGPFGIADWFLPTILFMPVAVIWSRRVRAGRPTTLDRRTSPVPTKR